MIEKLVKEKRSKNKQWWREDQTNYKSLRNLKEVI